MLGISTGTETIVLLESKPEMRRLLSQMLVLAGYTVREAADGAEAVRLIDEGAHTADMLLADIANGGGELAQRMARKYPKLRILVTAEQSDEEAAMDVVASGAHVMTKPLSPGALLIKVRQVLDGPLVFAASRSAAAGGHYPYSR